MAAHTNVLGYFNPEFYAREALHQLEKSLGMAKTVHRGYEAERNTFNKGDTINIKRPGSFTASDAPSTPANIVTESLQLVLSNWKEVKFTLTDKELAETQQQVIDDHIRPAAVALADNIDAALVALWTNIPHQVSMDPFSVNSLTLVRKTMVDNLVPIREMDRMWGELGTLTEMEALRVTDFNRQDGAGNVGIQQQITGTLGPKYGFNLYANQNIAAYTRGTAIGGDAAGTVDGALAIGGTVVTIDALAATAETVVPGDIITFTGFDQKYAVIVGSAVSGNAITLTVAPAFKTIIADGTVTTFSGVTSDEENLFYHKNAFALAMSSLPTIGNELGANVTVLQDPITGLTIRSRVYYMPDISEVRVALDVLYGVKCLDPNLAIRAYNLIA